MPIWNNLRLESRRTRNCAVLILVGMMFFTTGAETAMTPMGERIGTCDASTCKSGSETVK